MSISSDDAGSSLRIQPKVVDAGHHTRRLLRLTGIDAGENQARRLLNDLDSYRAIHFPDDEVDEEMGAHQWLSEVYDPIIRAIPREYRGKLEGPEIFHQWREHRAAGHARRTGMCPGRKASSPISSTSSNTGGTKLWSRVPPPRPSHFPTRPLS
jgi:hypothetical protein